jgi:hypothetical protein
VVERAPVQPGPSGRVILLIAAAIVVVLAAAGVALYIAGSDQTLSTDGGDRATGTASETTTSATPASDRPSVTSEVSFGTGGAVAESQYVVFGEPVSSVTLTVPAGVESVSGRTFHPRIGNLQVLTGAGTPVTMTDSMGSGDSINVDLPSPSREVNLVYTAYRSIVRVSPASPNEVMALLTPLLVSPLSGATTTIHINDTGVTDVACLRGNGTQRSCGLSTVHGWTVKRGPAQLRSMVVAELEVPH